MAADPANHCAVDACDANGPVAYAFVHRISRLVDDGPCVWRDVTELADQMLGADVPLLRGLWIEVANLQAQLRRGLVAGLRGVSLRGAGSAGGLALGGALLLEIELVARGARAEDEAEEHADQQHAGDEQDVSGGHVVSFAAAA